MAILDFLCRSCGARCWCNDRDVASRIRATHRQCRSCDLDAAQDVRVAFGAIQRRETARMAVVKVEPLPSTLGVVLGACVVLAIGAVFLAEFAVEALVTGAIVAGVFWFAQLVGRFLA